MFWLCQWHIHEWHASTKFLPHPISGGPMSTEVNALIYTSPLTNFVWFTVVETVDTRLNQEQFRSYVGEALNGDGRLAQVIERSVTEDDLEWSQLCVTSR